MLILPILWLIFTKYLKKGNGSPWAVDGKFACRAKLDPELMCKKLTHVPLQKESEKDTTGLLSSDWPKITFIFHPKSGKVVTSDA